jgi:hypothetical protein
MGESEQVAAFQAVPDVRIRNGGEVNVSNNSRINDF